MQSVTQIFNSRQVDSPGDRLPPAPPEFTAWIGARVDYIHIHGVWPDIETGTVLDAAYNARGYLRLLIQPDRADRLTKWRDCPHDILVVL
jgi:hypothetical protein